MHEFVAYPIAYPLITAIVIYGIGLPIALFRTQAAYIVTSVLWYLYTLAFWVITYLFVVEYFDERVPLRKSFVGFFNTLFVAVHMVAAFGMTFWLLDFTVNKNAVYSSIPPSILDNVYLVYFSEFLPTAGNFVLQTGFLAVRPVDGSALAGLWSLYGSVMGVLTIVVLFAFVVRQRLRRK